jgi:hypothetical protein
MQLLDRVVSNIHLCGVELSFTSTVVPSNITGWQPFYNSTFQNYDFQKAYASLASINFDEESNESSSGTSYKQKVTFRFPNSDSQRSNRIKLLEKVKFIKLKQTNGLDIVFGRNDFNQNARPKMKIKQNEQICEVSFETSSIFPSGYTPNINAFGLPVFIPLSF